MIQTKPAEPSDRADADPRIRGYKGYSLVHEGESATRIAVNLGYSLGKSKAVYASDEDAEKAIDGGKAGLVCFGFQWGISAADETYGFMGKGFRAVRSVEEALRFSPEDLAKPWSPRRPFTVVRVMFAEPESERWADRNYPLPRKKPSKAVREAVWAKFGGRCAYCGREIPLNEMQVDHLVPYSGEAGRDDITNFMPACRDCNSFKRNDALEEFRSHLERSYDLKEKHRGSGHKYKVVDVYGIKPKSESKVVFYFEKEDKGGTEDGQGEK